MIIFLEDLICFYDSGTFSSSFLFVEIQFGRLVLELLLFKSSKLLFFFLIMDTSTAMHEKVLCDPGGQEQSKEGSGVDDRIAIFHLLARGRATTGVVGIAASWAIYHA